MVLSSPLGIVSYVWHASFFMTLPKILLRAALEFLKEMASFFYLGSSFFSLARLKTEELPD